MPRFTVKHHQAVWETTTFEVEVPDPLPERWYDVADYIKDNLEEMMYDAIERDEADVACGDTVSSMDSDIEIRDATGNKIYWEIDK